MLQEAASGLNAAERAALSSKHEQLLARVRAGCAAHTDQANAEMMTLIADARAAIAAIDAVEAALKARLEGAGAAVPELKRFLERMLATLERGAAARAATNGAAKPINAQTAAEAPVQNGHAIETVAAAGAIGCGSSRPDLLARRRREMPRPRHRVLRPDRAVEPDPAPRPPRAPDGARWTSSN